MAELRSFSTRARITPTTFVNEYSWGNFKGDEEAWMERYFDALIYVANLGTHILTLALPQRLLEQLPRIPELANQVPQVSECLRVTGEDCFYLKIHLRSIDDLSPLLDRFLVYGETNTSLINDAPVPRRDPPVISD